MMRQGRPIAPPVVRPNPMMDRRQAAMAAFQAQQSRPSPARPMPIGPAPVAPAPAPEGDSMAEQARAMGNAYGRQPNFTPPGNAYGREASAPAPAPAQGMGNFGPWGGDVKPQMPGQAQDEQRQMLQEQMQANRQMPKGFGPRY